MQRQVDEASAAAEVLERRAAFAEARAAEAEAQRAVAAAAAQESLAMAQESRAALVQCSDEAAKGTAGARAAAQVGTFVSSFGMKHLGPKIADDPTALREPASS
jgi:hypothetical protein